MKYKVGQEVKHSDGGYGNGEGIGRIVEILRDDLFSVKTEYYSSPVIFFDYELEPITNSKITKIKPYMRKKYMLLKDSFDLKKGAVLEEDGEKYRCITPEKIKYAEYREDYTLFKQIVINNPKWFKEVTIMYVAKEQVKKVEKFLQKLI